LNSKVVIQVWKHSGLPLATSELQFDPERRWRFDFAFPDSKIAVEVQGGIWTKGRHTRGAALKAEWEKLNTAAIMGWRILYCEPSEVCSKGFIDQIRDALDL